MNLENLFNLLFNKKLNVLHKPTFWSNLVEPQIEEAFKSSGPGLYVVAFASENNNIISKIISLFRGKFSYITLVWYTRNLKTDIYKDEWTRLLEKYRCYYGDLPDIEEKLMSTKILILGLLDKDGPNYLNYSRYTLRSQVILKPKLSTIQQRDILHQMLKKNKMSMKFNYSGAYFSLLKIFDNERAWYRSEQTHNILTQRGCRTARKKNPSPTRQVKYRKNWVEKIIYSNIKKI